MLLLKSLRIGFVGLMLFVASAWAASSVLEGIVKDAKGHPIEGADIRIETKNGGKWTRQKSSILKQNQKM